MLLRGTSPGEDEILPAITALCLSSSSSSDGSEPDEERKWREALRAALEEVGIPLIGYIIREENHECKLQFCRTWNVK